jgi:nickel/cobalt transporter (NicO) family protein
MPVKTVVGGRPVVHFLLLVAAVAGLLLLVGIFDAAFAQGSPFGAPRGQAPAVPVGGVLGWISAWSLFGLSFFYGIFHAAGPGHGKAVISSDLVANEETWRRGVVLSFASALIQALVAVAVVGVAAALLNATAATMKNAVNVIETVSYALIIVKFRDCVGSERGRPRPLPPSHLKSPRWEYCRVASATNCCVS